jgi:hypothetical protein
MSDRGCVDDAELERLTAGRLSKYESEAITKHADTCASCLPKVTAVRGSKAPTEKPSALAEPAKTAPKRPLAPLLIGGALLASLLGMGLLLAALSLTPRPTRSASYDATPAEVPIPEPTALTSVTSPETLAKVHEAFAKVSAPKGTDDATLALLKTAATDVDRAWREVLTKPDRKKRGELECLSLLSSDIELLLHEAVQIRSRSAAEGLVLACRELEYAAVCRGVAEDPKDAGRATTDPSALAHLRMRRPLSVSPVVPGPNTVPTKSGLFALAHVASALGRDENAFPEDGQMFGELIGAMMGRIDDTSQLRQREADDMAKKALVSVIAHDGGKTDIDVPLARGLAFSEALSMDAFRARFSIQRATRNPHDAARALGELFPLVRRADDPRTTAYYATERLRLDAARGAVPPPDTTASCMALEASARKACLPILEAVGEFAVDRPMRDVDLEIATAKAVYGEDHPRVAFALVHAAEWLAAHERPELARTLAEHAKTLLQASLSADEGVELALFHARSDDSQDGGAPLTAWTTALQVGDETHSKYVHLSRAYAVLVAVLAEPEAKKSAAQGRALTGRDPVSASILPVELAAIARFTTSTPDYDLEKAATRLGHPKFLARALARLAASEHDEEKARASYARAIGLVAMLPAQERVALRVAAATIVKDKTVARSLVETALAEAAEKDKPRIAALLLALPDTPNAHGSRP